MAKKKTTKKAKFDVSKHEMVPKHSKLNQKETKELLDKYNIEVKELPKIVAKDPALQGLDVKEGDVIKVERKSPTVGHTVYYRGVING